MPRVPHTTRSETERRVLLRAAELVAQDGLDRLSMRAVAAAVGVQTPALYRLFEDKDALLRRLTSFAFEQYLAAKQEVLDGDDPITDLDRGWDLHVGFGLDNPELYPLMFGAARTEAQGDVATPADAAHALLTDVLQRIAAQGALTTSVEAAAVRIHAATVGATFFLLGLPPGRRDPALMAPFRDSVHRPLLRDRSALEDFGAGTAGGARAVLAHLGDTVAATERHGGLGPAETALLRTWLERLAD